MDQYETFSGIEASQNKTGTAIFHKWINQVIHYIKEAFPSEEIAAGSTTAQYPAKLKLRNVAVPVNFSYAMRLIFCNPSKCLPLPGISAQMHICD
jgi:hypothetical protein